MGIANARKYDKEFKTNAIKLLLESGRTMSKVGKELGIPTATLAGWLYAYKESGEEAFPGKGHLKPADAELSQLRKELAVVREERDILKKALSIFTPRQR
jgi:transposase